MKRWVVIGMLWLYVMQGWALEIIFRYDDFRLKDDAVQNALIELFAKEEVPLHIAVIPYTTGGAPCLEEGAYLERIKELQQEGIIQLALHGYDHGGNAKYGEMYGLSEAEQRSRLEHGSAMLDSVFGTKIHLFIPTWNRYDQTTLDILADMGYTMISSSFSDDIDVSDGRFQYYLAEEIPQAILKNQIDRFAESDGLLVCLFHPNDFYSAAAMEDMRDLLKIAKADKEIRIMTMGGLYEEDQSFGEERIKANLPHTMLSKFMHKNRIILQVNEAKQLRRYNNMIQVAICVLSFVICLLVCLLGIKYKENR